MLRLRSVPAGSLRGGWAGVPGWAGMRVLPRTPPKPVPCSQQTPWGLPLVSPCSLGKSRDSGGVPTAHPLSASAAMHLHGWLKKCWLPPSCHCPCPLSCPDPDPARSQWSRKLQQGPLRQLPKLLSSAACPPLVLLSASSPRDCFDFHFQLKPSLLHSTA